MKKVVRLSLGERLSGLEVRFNVSGNELARYLGLSSSDYHNKYKSSEKPPTNAWSIMILAIEMYGYWWTPLARIESLSERQIENIEIKYRELLSSSPQLVKKYIDGANTKKFASEIIFELCEIIHRRATATETTLAHDSKRVENIFLDIVRRYIERDKESKATADIFTDIMRLIKTYYSSSAIQSLEI